MIKKLPTILCICFMYHISFAQFTRVLIEGAIKNPSSKPIINANIINLTTKVGTISNKDGKFTIPVKIGDWLQISNLQYSTKKIKIKKGNIKERTLLVYLIPVTTMLDEVVIKKKMKGFLTLDRIKNEKNPIGNKMKNLVNGIISIPIDKIKKMKIGENEQYLQRPTVTPGLLPHLRGVGAGATIPDFALIKKRKLRKKLAFKLSFPEKLKKILGEHFFFVKLKIPKEKYYHFLEYCNPLGIEALYKDEKKLELLKILLKESKSYLLLLENNK